VTAQRVDTHSEQQLMQDSVLLRELASKANGEAGKILQEYPGHYTMLAYRETDGQAELHGKMADFFVVLDGSATLVTGGTIVNPKSPRPDEVRGDEVQGGKSVKLGKGDVIHIPSNVPHQLLIPSGQSLTYFVIKVEELR
jgi:mannose-6-phosphate isomerase-like protein (cupin superfamily)